MKPSLFGYCVWLGAPLLFLPFGPEPSFAAFVSTTGMMIWVMVCRYLNARHNAYAGALLIPILVAFLYQWALR